MTAYFDSTRGPTTIAIISKVYTIVIYLLLNALSVSKVSAKRICKRKETVDYFFD